MKTLLKILAAALLMLALAVPALANDKPVVVMETNEGTVMIVLDARKAPVTVENFLKYVDSGHYDGTIFHRVIKDFMIQGGNFEVNMKQRATDKPIKIESTNGLKNKRGTIAMARTMDPNSATDQFFINVRDNSFLNYKAPTMKGYGYTVFGKVLRGMDVVDKISGVRTTSRKGHRDVPRQPIYIKKMYRHQG